MLNLQSQHVDAATLQKRAEMADLGHLAPSTPEVMAITNNANWQLNDEPDVAMQQIHAKYAQNVQQHKSASCANQEIAVRKEW